MAQLLLDIGKTSPVISSSHRQALQQSIDDFTMWVFCWAQSGKIDQVYCPSALKDVEKVIEAVAEITRQGIPKEMLEQGRTKTSIEEQTSLLEKARSRFSVSFIVLSPP